MKKILIFLIGCVIALSCNKKEVIINAADYGLSDTLKDVTPIINKIVAICKEKSATKLIIANGEYEFYPDKAFEKYSTISNNDKGKKRIAFPIIGMKNFEIDANGASFIFHGNMIPFELEQSENIIIKNLAIDWQRTFHSEGKVVAVDAKNKTFDIEISEEYPYMIKGNELIFIGEGWMQNIEKNLFFDPNTSATVYKVLNYKLDPWNPWLSKRYGAKEIEKGLVRITDSIAELPQEGWIFVSKGGLQPDRQSPAIHAFNTFNLTLESVKIYHAGAMGVIAERCGDITLKKVKIMLPPSKNRMVSTTADATHFVGCKGTIIFDGCLFENMLDDATNVHGIYVNVVDIIDDYTIGVQRKHFQQAGFQFASTGDSIQILQKSSLKPYLIFKVVSVNDVNEEYMQITFDKPVKGVITENSAAENITWYPEVIMRNCIVQNNRARSILISSAKKMIIENNSFSSMMAAVVVGGSDANYWYESGSVNEVIIRNNKFIDCCTSGHEQSVIMIEPIILKPDSSFYFENNIIIDSNYFATFDNSILLARSTNKLNFSNNTIDPSGTFAPIFPNNPIIDITQSKDIIIFNNEYKGDKKATIKVEGNIDLKTEGNKGF